MYYHNGTTQSGLTGSVANDQLIWCQSLTEPIGPPRLPRVLAPVRRVLALHERRVDRPATHRRLQRPVHRLLAPQHELPMDRHDAILGPLLADCRVGQTRIGTPLGQQRTTTWPGGRRGDDFDEGRGNDRLVGRVLVAGHQRGRLISESVLDLGDDLLDALGDPRPGDDRQDQLVLGVVGDVVPPVPLVIIDRVGGIAILLLLGHERPLLVELDLAGPRGKKPRAPHEHRGHASRRGGPVGPQCWVERRRGVRSVECRCPRLAHVWGRSP